MGQSSTYFRFNKTQLLLATMRLLVIFVIVFNFNQGGFAQEGAQEPIQCEGPCDPCICREVPGLVFDTDINECAWPDEVGCKLTDLGFAASCDGEIDGTTKAVDFEMPYLPEGTTKEQYFVVCVFESTPADIEKRKVKELQNGSCHRVLLSHAFWDVPMVHHLVVNQEVVRGHMAPYTKLVIMVLIILNNCLKRIIKLKRSNNSIILSLFWFLLNYTSMTKYI